MATPQRIATQYPELKPIRQQLDAGVNPGDIVADLVMTYGMSEEEAWLWVEMSSGKIGMDRGDNTPEEIRELERQIAELLK